MRLFRRIFMLILATAMVGGMMAQIQWRDVYQVKKKDTIYGIAKAYGITIDELMDANPEMKQPDYKLKKGSSVFIPMEKKAEEKKPEVKKERHTKPGQTVRIGVMLPLHDENGDGQRMVEYYRGLLIGCDSLRKEGISTEIHAWNVAEKTDIRIFLTEPEARQCDVIFGPLYSAQVTHLANFCQKNDIKMVIPFSTTAQDVMTNKCVWQVYQGSQRQWNRSYKVFVDRFIDCNVVFIDCNDSTSQKGPFVQGLRNALDAAKINCRMTNLNSGIEYFQKAFAKDRRNVVVLNTGRSPQLNLVFRKLNVLTELAPELQISMFGYTDWLLYEKTYRELFHSYDAYIPSTYYYYKGLSRIAAFEQNYQKWFNTPVMDRYIPRLALVGYDQVQFFVRGLWKNGSEFTGEKGQLNYNCMQNPYRFEQIAADGGYQNNSFMLVHYKDNRVIEKLEY